MLYNYLADAVVIIHCLFVLFVVAGGLLLLKWKRTYWFHLPAAAWGAAIEFAGWICPLTPLENSLREKAGEAAYQGGFIEHYVLPILYPEGLTREVQLLLGVCVIVINAAIYSYIFWIKPRKQR